MPIFTLTMFPASDGDFLVLRAIREDEVAAAAADADDLDLRALVELFDHFDGHVSLLEKVAVAKQVAVEMGLRGEPLA